MTLSEAISQIEFCDFQCQGGSLENNEGWKKLMEFVEEAKYMSYLYRAYHDPNSPAKIFPAQVFFQKWWGE